MTRYQYRGPVPVPDENGELVHPLDVREFSEAPDCPPWELVKEPEGKAPVPEPEAAVPAVTPPARPARTAKGS